MKTAFLFFTIVIFSHSFSHAQETDAKARSEESQLFGEVSGPGVGLSLNYEKLYWKGCNGIGFSAGTGLCPFIDAAALTVPFGIDYVHGKKHAFELGFGSTPLVFTGKYSSDSEWMFYFLGGYRRVLLNGDVIGRVFFSPFLAKQGSLLASNLGVNGRFIPYGGLSLGVLLKKKRSRST